MSSLRQSCLMALILTWVHDQCRGRFRRPLSKKLPRRLSKGDLSRVRRSYLREKIFLDSSSKIIPLNLLLRSTKHFREFHRVRICNKKALREKCLRESVMPEAQADHIHSHLADKRTSPYNNEAIFFCDFVI